MADRITTPDGRAWRVRRRWVPRLGAETVWGRFHRRFRQTFRRVGELGDADPGFLEIFAEGFVVGIVVLVAVLAVVFVGIPLLLAVVDLLVVILLALIGVVARVAFRRPWTIEARAEDDTTLVWPVVGWRASTERRHQVEQQLGAGIVPPTEKISAEDH